MKQELKIEPLSDYIFVRFKKEEKTKSGIILSDISKSKPCTAEVIAIGPGKTDRQGKFVKTALKVGDTVIVDPFLPQQIKIEDQELWAIRESDILARKLK